MAAISRKPSSVASVPSSTKETAPIWMPRVTGAAAAQAFPLPARTAPAAAMADCCTNLRRVAIGRSSRGTADVGTPLEHRLDIRGVRRIRVECLGEVGRRQVLPDGEGEEVHELVRVVTEKMGAEDAAPGLFDDRLEAGAGLADPA